MKLYHVLFFNVLMLFLSLPSAMAGERATWVVRFDIDTPEKVREICAPEHQRQFDRYLVQVRGRADSWYDSNFVPQAEGVDFDVLGLILQECTEVEVHAWMNVYYLWTGDTPPEDLRHPYYNDDWILRDRSGRSVKDYSELEQRQRWIEGVYADPASAGYRAYFVNVVEELIQNYNVAGVHLDFVRYPGSFFGARDNPVPAQVNPQQFGQWLNGSGAPATLARYNERIVWDLQRAEQVTRLVQDVHGVMAEVNPYLRLSASVFPDVVEAFLDKGQKWPDWLRMGLLDDIYIMAYFGDEARVQSQLQQCKTVCDRYPVRMWAGLGAYIKTARDIRQEISGAARFGLTDICLFSLGHLLKQRRNISDYLARSGAGADDADELEINSLPPLVKQVVEGRFTAHVPEKAHHDVERDRLIRLRGIFRYVDSHDDYAKATNQYQIMQDVEAKLHAGASFKELSLDYSQAGTKRQGGVLADLHYSEASAEMRPLFDLKPGEYSGIIATHNGFWLVQVLGAR